MTDPTTHRYRIEYLRYEPDSYLDDALQEHAARRVGRRRHRSLDKGKEIAIPPFEVGEPAFVRVAFVWEEGMISEYMAFKPGVAWFDPNDTGRDHA